MGSVEPLEPILFHFHGEFLENVGKMVNGPLSKFETPVQKP